MISFESDYTTGAHPLIIRKLLETNLEPLPGYGTDKYCESAKEKIRLAVGDPNAEVEFLVGGTQTNAAVISTMLSGFEGVVAAETGHVSAHEAGAIEYAGFKVLTLPQHNGKICPKELKKLVDAFYADENHEHMVFPGMVYISHPTEYGTLYSKSELKAIAEICKSSGMKLFLDGARLGYALASFDTDLTLPDIASLCDVFYIGGTKVGALCGEAIVFTKGCRPPHFMNQIKKRGALPAKGRLLGIQFDVLFTDGLYFEISRHAIEKAERLKKIFSKRDIRFFIDSPTNQQFVVLENNLLSRLKEKVAFGFWEKADEKHTVVRFATSWSTTDEDLDALEAALDSV